MRKINRRFSRAVRDLAPAVRASLAAGAPPSLLIDAAHRACIDRCTPLASRSLFDN